MLGDGNLVQNPGKVLEVLCYKCVSTLGMAGLPRVRTVMENLEKTWNIKICISRPGKVL